MFARPDRVTIRIRKRIATSVLALADAIQKNRMSASSTSLISVTRLFATYIGQSGGNLTATKREPKHAIVKSATATLQLTSAPSLSAKTDVTPMQRLHAL